MKVLKIINWRMALGVLLCLTLLLTTSCNQQKKSAASGQGADWALVQEYSQGALHLVVRVDKLQLSVAQTLTLELKAEVDESYSVKFPELDGQFGGFALRNSTISQPSLTSAKLLEVSKTYLLEPEVPGDYLLPAMTVSAWKQGEEQTGVDEVQLEEISVKVLSLFAADEQEPMLSDVLPPVAAPWNRWLIVAIGLALLLCAILLYWWLKRQKHKKELPPPPIPAHIKAHRELDLLLAEGLLAKGEVKEFYGSLSNILRHYIEDRFGVKAPERTTEEFLGELGKVNDSSRFSSFGDQQFVSRHKAMLQDFLNRCDLVKFAKHRPVKEEIEGGVLACRQFIDQTIPSGQDSSGSSASDGAVTPQIVGGGLK